MSFKPNNGQYIKIRSSQKDRFLHEAVQGCACLMCLVHHVPYLTLGQFTKALNVLGHLFL